MRINRHDFYDYLLRLCYLSIEMPVLWPIHHSLLPPNLLHRYVVSDGQDVLSYNET
jgi:hypothetical protein